MSRNSTSRPYAFSLLVDQNSKCGIEELRNPDMGPRKPYSNVPPSSSDTTSSMGKHDMIHSIQEADTFYSRKEVELPPTKFDRRRQLRRLVLDGFLRFLLTIGLIGSLYGTFIHFETHGLISQRSKRIFNFLVTGLSMLLGIAIASSFKSIATNLRWWVLSRRKRPLEEVNGILACHSLIEVAKLGFASARRSNFGLAVCCSLWLVLNLAAQAAVASLGLTYSLNQAANADPSQPIPGDVSFTNMTQSFTRAEGDDGYDNLSSSQIAAHTFGENALQYIYETLSEPDETGNTYLYPVYFPTIWSYPNGSTYQYYFQETQYYTPEGTNNPNFYSNRSISVTTVCESESEIDFLANATSATQNSTSFLASSTVFYTSTDENCGPRCAIINATESNSTDSSTGWVYTCNVTVSSVFNASVPEHQIPDINAFIGAGAIALQGYQAASDFDIQAQIYPVQSYYGQYLNGNTTAMAGKLSSFASGVFASADQTLPSIDTSYSGFIPNTGLELDIQDPKYMWAIFGGIAGVHLVLFLTSVYVANRVIVIDDSDLAIALLLRTVADDFAEKGCLLDDEERERKAREYEVVYAPRISDKRGGETRVLEISKFGDRVRDPKGWEGYYDS